MKCGQIVFGCTIKDLNHQKMYSPSEMLVIKKRLLNEIAEFDYAKELLLNLESSINELKSLLSSEIRNENDLQRCLNNNPLLFGLEYKKIIPKYKLGKEYVTDYALERFPGFIDVVELESSNLRLFTKTGNPTSELVHAEQQVFDWLDWIEKNNSYARNDLPNLLTPFGYVIIGTNDTLSDSEKSKLFRRNLILKNTLRIMTYNDLLENAIKMFNILKGIN